jgi:hypothetical protein
MLTVSFAELWPMKSPIAGTVIIFTMAVLTVGGGIFIPAVPFAKPSLEPHEDSIKHTAASATAAPLAKENFGWNDTISTCFRCGFQPYLNVLICTQYINTDAIA